MTQTASGFVCRGKQSGSNWSIGLFYNRNVVSLKTGIRFNAICVNVCQSIRPVLKSTAQKYDLDWHLLAAIGYQESYLKPNSVSPLVFVVWWCWPIAQPKPWVSNRTDPAQSIQGGAKYYDQMLSRYEDIPFLTVTGMHWLRTIWDRVRWIRFKTHSGTR